MASEIHYFQGKVPDRERLLSFGFRQQGEGLVYRTGMPVFGFEFRLTLHPDEVTGEMTAETEVLDLESNEPYVLHLSPDAAGEFVGRVREEYDRILETISAACFDQAVFQGDVVKALIDHVAEKYGDTPEFLWPKFSKNAVWRRCDNRKWYGVLLTVSLQKLGLASEKEAVILDLRGEPEEIAQLVMGNRYFPGYHMNKKHWYTLILDGSVPLEEICRRLEESYRLAATGAGKKERRKKDGK